MKKKATIYDIAEELNITVSTVSRALNNLPTISDATKKAVLEVAKKLNYSPNRLASSLKSGKTNTIGVIIPSMEIHFFALVIHSIEQLLKHHGYRVLLYQSKESVESEINGVKTLLEAQVDGIIASMSLETEDTSHFQSLIKQNKPLVLFDRVDKNLQVPTVTLDDYKAGYMATQHLIEQGYQNIAFITTVHQNSIFGNRVKGYKAALADYGLEIKENQIVYGGLSIKDGRYGVNKLMRAEDRPDAIIAGDDYTALGVIKKLKELELSPPEIGVIGFANETFSAFITPNLSTIDQQASKMGIACAQSFIKMIKNENLDGELEHTVIEPVLVVRQSTSNS